VDALAEGGAVQPLQILAGLRPAPAAPVLTVFNKADLLGNTQRKALLLENSAALCISARTGEGVDQLLAAIAPHIPESPFLYPEDELSAQSMRFFAGEMIREAAMEQLDQEVPYSLACEVEEYRENDTPLYIRATLHVERESQKAIVIGAKGSRIREIGTAARRKIEGFLGTGVYLDLRVKVLADWRRNPAHLRRLGYNIKEEESR
jgi:GTP-binding protein Era